MFKKETKQIVKMAASMVTIVTVSLVLTERVLWPWVIATE